MAMSFTKHVLFATRYPANVCNHKLMMYFENFPNAVNRPVSILDFPNECVGVSVSHAHRSAVEQRMHVGTSE